MKNLFLLLFCTLVTLVASAAVPTDTSNDLASSQDNHNAHIACLHRSNGICVPNQPRDAPVPSSNDSSAESADLAPRYYSLCVFDQQCKANFKCKHFRCRPRNSARDDVPSQARDVSVASSDDQEDESVDVQCNHRINGKCVDNQPRDLLTRGYRTCNANADCHRHWWCNNGRCRPRLTRRDDLPGDISIASSEHEDDASVDIQPRRKAHRQTCKASSDCAPHHRCLIGYCRFRSNGRDLLERAVEDHPADGVDGTDAADDGSQGECINNKQCGPTARCVKGVCVPALASEEN